VTNLVEAGDAVIDLGSYGKLIAPVQVDGGQWFYYWDCSGDGTAADTGSLNGGVDTVSHNVLDNIFNHDIYGFVNTTVINTDQQYGTTNAYRYATINGVHLALLSAGGGTIDRSSPATAVGSATASDGSNAVNSTYNDLLAVWDAYNGVATGNPGGNPVLAVGPSGWGGQAYWSATPSSYTHAAVEVGSGYLQDLYDGHSRNVALQVLPS